MYSRARQIFGITMKIPIKTEGNAIEGVDSEYFAGYDYAAIRANNRIP